VVSNHGGRALDGTPGTAETLPFIADTVSGQMTILVDGGIRSGADVLKMLALGADAVLLGRPLAISAVGGGAEGVAMMLNKIAGELQAAMVLTGSLDVAEISAEVLW
jgi:isopentenyl diphosphate isomerase/L-lactate dehydrogenase-like FMN-dependent dehydrogenase